MNKGSSSETLSRGNLDLGKLPFLSAHYKAK